MKTINLELSKRLAPYLENIETEYSYYNIFDTTCPEGPFDREEIYQSSLINVLKLEYGKENVKKICKTLTLEETIDFLPDFTLNKVGGEYIIYYKGKNTKGNNLLNIVEKLLEYLLDNNLLGEE